MIIGLLLAISLSISLTSIIIIATSTTGILKENLATGAVIGASQATSYAITTLALSLIATFSFILILRNKISN
ncbi:MAG: hypothetical protein KJ592_03075 [Nanoarchaeota archaeon]|nr:hypothetical protein [Nanoarchaeota archaeon]